MQHGRMRSICKALESALQDLDRALDRTKLAVGEPLELCAEHPVRPQAATQLLAPGFGQPKREPPPVLRVRLPFDKPGPDECVDRAADCRSPALDGRGYLVEGCGLALRNRFQKLPPRSFRALRRPVGDPFVSDAREPHRKRGRGVGKGKLLHDKGLNSNKVAAVKWPRRLRFSLSAAMPES